MPEWDGLLPPVSCGERPIIDNVRTPVAYSSSSQTCLHCQQSVSDTGNWRVAWPGNVV